MKSDHGKTKIYLEGVFDNLLIEELPGMMIIPAK